MIQSNVYKPWALVRIDGKLTLFYVTSIHSEGGFPVGGPITGYRGHPSDDLGEVFSGESVWIMPRDFFKDWRTRPSSANLYKAIDKALAPA